jgi:integrase
VASTEQVRALHEVFPTHLRPAVLLGAYAGLRTAEVVGLRRGDVDLEAGVVCPVQQAGGLELKTAMSRTPVPVPRRLAEALLTPRDGVLEDGALDGLTLPQKPHNPQNPEPPGDSAATAVSAATSRPRDGLPDTPVVTDETGQRPTSTWAIERAIRSARPKIAGLPEGFRYHDLRHYYASMLIASGLDVKTVQHRLRHGSATTTLNTYGHLWPDGDERTRAAVDGALGDLLD